VILRENLLDDVIELFHLRLQCRPSAPEIALQAENLPIDGQPVEYAAINNRQNPLNRGTVM
jgi:hypothetical protein